MSSTPAPTSAEIGRRVEEREAALEPVRKRCVVGVHARDVATARLVERAIERSREAELLVVAEDADARIAERASVSAVPSEEQSSTTTSSRSDDRLAQDAVSAVRTNGSPSCTATRTETSGAVGTGVS